MTTQITDTHPEVERVQISLIRQASTGRRISLMCSLSETVIKLSRRAIQRSRPSLSNREIDLLFVEYHYGADLANRLREYLNRKAT
jgi:hypothetical protein